MITDTSEKGLENIIEAFLLDKKGERDEYLRWISRESKDFNKEFCLDEGCYVLFLKVHSKKR